MTVKLAIMNVNPVGIQIVMICTQVVEPLAVPRSSSIAPTPATAPTVSPTSTTRASSRSRWGKVMVTYCHSRA